MKKMNPEVKEKWLAALRSGEYQHGKNRLVTVNEEGKLTYCCLGVLCDIYVKETGKAEWRDEGTKLAFVPGDNPIDKEHAYLTREVVDWSGLPDKNPTMQDGEDRNSLAIINDKDTTRDFSPLIELIEQQL